MSLHPVRTAVGVEHNRRQAFAQAVVMALCLFALSTPSARAGDDGTAAVNLLPKNAQHRGIVLKSQTVDTTIGEDQGKVWADTKVWLKLDNPASKPITVSVTLPGPQMNPVPLPANLEVRVNKAPLRLTPVAGTHGGQPAAATASIGIPARRSVDVSMAFRQDLPESNGVFTYTYPLDGAAQWAGTPESLRVTVRLKPPIVMRSLLTFAPAAHRSDAQALTWDWEARWNKADVNVGLVFMSPTWFGDFEKAKAAATKSDAATEHLSLSQHYQRLASLPALLPNAQSGFQSRYYPAAIAELQAALEARATPAEQTLAHSLLAEVYAQQANSVDSNSRERYLQAAAAEIELVTRDSAPTPDLIALAGTVFGELSDHADARGDEAAVAAYSQMLERVRFSSLQPAAQDQFAGKDLLQVTDALAQGDTKTARELVAARDQSPDAAPSSSAEPVVSRTTLTVTTTSEGRQIVVQLGNGENLAKASELAERVADALRSSGTGQVIAATNTVTITLGGRPSRALLQQQRSMAAALPPTPELALLRSLLADVKAAAETQTGMFASTWRYTETVDLAPALEQWNEIAAEIESTQGGSPQGAPASEAEQLKGISRSLNRFDAAAWRRLAESSTVDYRFDYTTSDADREWQMRAGESRQVSVQQSRWDLEGIRWAALAVCVALLGLAALVWRLA